MGGKLSPEPFVSVDNNTPLTYSSSNPIKPKIAALVETVDSIKLLASSKSDGIGGAVHQERDRIATSDKAAVKKVRIQTHVETIERSPCPSPCRLLTGTYSFRFR